MRTTVPEQIIQIESQAFEQGFLTASSEEYVGWNIQQPPTEDTVVQFMCDFLDIVNSDLASAGSLDLLCNEGKAIAHLGKKRKMGRGKIFAVPC